MGWLSNNVEFPKAPKTPLFVCFMSVSEKIPARTVLSGMLEHTPFVSEIYAFIPYLDLPNYALDEERAMAFVTVHGTRGWLSRGDIETYFDDKNDWLETRPSPNAYTHFMKMLNEAGWAVTPIKWEDIDWEQHLRKRTDDGDIDLIPMEWFKGFHHVNVCTFCGHTNPRRLMEREQPCEACNFDPKKDETLVHADDPVGDSTTFSENFSDEWS